MKSLFPMRSIMNIFVNLTGSVVVAILVSTFKYFDFTQSIIIACLTFIILNSITNHFELEKRIDELTNQFASQIKGGNPNAVFELSDQNQAITQIIKSAESDILFVGTSFVGFLSLESHVIIQSLERGLKVRILILAPYKDSFLEDVQLSKTQEKEFEYSLLQLEKIKQLTSGLKGTLEVRSTQTPLTISGLQCDGSRYDGTILISLFAPTSFSGVNLPYFVVSKRTSSELFSSFSRYLELAWGNSILIQKEVTLSRDN